jgi:hypothetical protein
MNATLYPNYQIRRWSPKARTGPRACCVCPMSWQQLDRHGAAYNRFDCVRTHRLHNLTRCGNLYRHPALDPIGEARKRVRFAAEMPQAQNMVPDWVQDFAFHPMGFDLNGSRGPSILASLRGRNIFLVSSAARSKSFPARSRRGKGVSSVPSTASLCKPSAS